MKTGTNHGFSYKNGGETAKRVTEMVDLHTKSITKQDGGRSRGRTMSLPAVPVAKTMPDIDVAIA